MDDAKPPMLVPKRCGTCEHYASTGYNGKCLWNAPSLTFFMSAAIFEKTRTVSPDSGEDCQVWEPREAKSR